MNHSPGLPDVLFSNQTLQFWNILEGLEILLCLVAICYVFWEFVKHIFPILVFCINKKLATLTMMKAEIDSRSIFFGGRDSGRERIGKSNPKLARFSK
jgi:hypothetical protein